MRQFSAEDIHAVLDYAPLIDALQEAFATESIEVPGRGAYEVGVPEAPAHMLVMPAWRRGDVLGVKLVNIFPANSKLGIGGVHGIYLLFDGKTGVPAAVMDGDAITNRRTAAASALASRYLSRSDSRTLLMIGAGNLAPHFIAAHAAVRPIEQVLIYGRTRRRAEELAEAVRANGLGAEVVDDIDAATPRADIITCATASRAPLVHGAHVRPGTHVDLVGAFTFEMRESDDDLILRSSIFADTRAGVMAEAGDLLQPIAAGLWSEDLLKGDLHDLCSGKIKGRSDPQEITLFKSVGDAVEDLVAADLVLAKSAP